MSETGSTPFIGYGHGRPIPATATAIRRREQLLAVAAGATAPAGTAELDDMTLADLLQRSRDLVAAAANSTGSASSDLPQPQHLQVATA